MLCCTPATYQSDAASNHSHPALLPGGLVAELSSRFCSQLIEVTAVWQPQIWRDECTAAGFTQLLHVASLQTLQTNIVVYDTHYRRLGQSLSLDNYVCWACAQPSWLSVSSSNTANFLQYVCTSACHCHALWLALHVFSNVSSPPFILFYHEIQLLAWSPFTNVQHKTAPKSYQQL